MASDGTPQNSDGAYPSISADGSKVLMDTIVVRSVLVTAINLDLGSRIWWPSRLDRDDEPLPPAAPDREKEHQPV